MATKAQNIDGLKHRSGRAAIFRPKRLDTLRPELLPMIGRRVEVVPMGHADAEPYAGQQIWMADFHVLREDDPLLGFWAPEEDLEWED